MARSLAHAKLFREIPNRRETGPFRLGTEGHTVFHQQDALEIMVQKQPKLNTVCS